MEDKNSSRITENFEPTIPCRTITSKSHVPNFACIQVRKISRITRRAQFRLTAQPTRFEVIIPILENGKPFGIAFKTKNSVTDLYTEPSSKRANSHAKRKC